MFLTLVLAQATTAVAPTEADRVVIDLLVPQPCAEEDVQRLQGEIVVCANREGDRSDRLATEPTIQSEAMPRAEVQLADGVAASAETESADMGMARSQRLMVRLKFKF